MQACGGPYGGKGLWMLKQRQALEARVCGGCESSCGQALKTRSTGGSGGFVWRLMWRLWRLWRQWRRRWRLWRLVGRTSDAAAGNIGTWSVRGLSCLRIVLLGIGAGLRRPGAPGHSGRP
eukprot:scaffold75457_cov75-Phaeocystis_antarctica.AAC.4